MGRQVTAEAFDCVQIERRIQEEIYEETRGMKPDEFLAYIHKQVQESRFAAFFTGPGEMPPTSDRGAFQPVAAPMRVGEADAEYNVTGDRKEAGRRCGD